MKNVRNLILVALMGLTSIPTAKAAHSYFPSNIWAMSSPTDKYIAKCVVAITAAAAVGYGIYRMFFRSPSNEKLRSQAHEVYNRLEQKYAHMKFVKYPDRMKIVQSGDLFALTNHPDLPLVKRVNGDLIDLQKQISLLAARINSDSEKGISDGAMQSLYNKMRSLEGKLSRVAKFWESHATFFTMHNYLTELSQRYSKYDYNNPQAIRMQVRGEATGKHGNAFIYPFKTFTMRLSAHIESLKERIEQLRTKARSFGDRELIANEYYNILSQAEPFYQALIYVRDVAANQPEYATEMKQFEKAERQRKDREAQERAALARAQAEQEKAEAIRYKAEMEYLAKTQKPAAQTNVTVVNQTASAHPDAYAADNNA